MTARELTDFTKIALTRTFQAKGNAGSMLLEELQPVVVAHDLENGPNKPFQRWTAQASIAAVAAQFSSISFRLVNPSPPQNVEQTLVIDSVIADVAWRAGAGTSDTAFTTAVGQATAYDHDFRTGKFDGGLGLHQPGFVDDIVGLFGNDTNNRVITVMVRGFPNVPTPISITLQRRLFLEATVPTFMIQAEAVNVAMRVLVSGRLFAIKS